MVVTKTLMMNELMEGKECEHGHSDTRRQYVYELEIVHNELLFMSQLEHWVIAALSG